MGKFRKAAWLLAAALLAPLAAAQERPLTFRFGTTLSWDSNVFRVPDGAPDPQASRGIEGKSDRFATGYFGVRLDTEYSQQRFVLNAVERLVRYDKFDSLDRDELDYDGAWLWSLGSRLSGSLRTTRTESLVPFEDTLSSGRNETVSTSNSASVDLRVYGGLHLLGGISETERRNSQVFLAQPNTRQTNHDVSVRYTTDAANAITYTRRSSRGSNFGEVLAVELSNDFTVHENSLSGTWSSGGAQALSGRLYWTEYRYARTPGRDFSGNGGEIAHTWSITTTFVTRLSAARSISPWTAGLDASYRVDETFAFAPTWRVSEKISALFRAYRTATDYRGAIIAGANEDRHDVQRGARLGMTWTPLERLSLIASFARERRTSSDPANNFDASIVALDAALSF